MKRSMRAVLAILAASAGVTLHAEETKAPEAVLCPKCETVWIKAPIGGKAQSYTRVGKMVCEDCRTAVENIFAGGKLEHACKTCGDIVACEASQGKTPKAQDATDKPKAVDGAHSHHAVHPTGN